MGTNYYVGTNECKCCKRYDEGEHIGKSSYGWCFSFRGYPDLGLKSWKDWKDYLKDKTIYDEYGEKVPYKEFVQMIETYKSPKHNKFQHNAEGRKSGWFDPEYDWDDDQGYPFGSRWFS